MSCGTSYRIKGNLLSVSQDKINTLTYRPQCIDMRLVISHSIITKLDVREHALQIANKASARFDFELGEYSSFSIVGYGSL